MNEIEMDETFIYVNIDQNLDYVDLDQESV